MIKEEKWYILPLKDLLPGDIILMRFYDKNSVRVMEKSHSSFSHATIYLGDSSVAEATTDYGVIANNLQRQLFENQDDAVVLRLKPYLFDPILIDKVIYKTRQLIGTEYGILEAVRIAEKEQRPKDGKPLSPNRQTCTRLTAQAYHEAGLDIVANYAYCSPEELLKSDKLSRLNVRTELATEEEIEFVNSENPIIDFVKAQFQLLLGARRVSGEDLQTLEQVSEYLLDNPELDHDFSEVLKQSDYTEIYKIEEELNPWFYDKGAFLDKFKDHRVEIAYVFKQSASNQLQLFQLNLTDLTASFEATNLEYFGLMKMLYENLVDQCERRIELADDILSDVDLIFD